MNPTLVVALVCFAVDLGLGYMVGGGRDNVGEMWGALIGAAVGGLTTLALMRIDRNARWREGRNPIASFVISSAAMLVTPFLSGGACVLLIVLLAKSLD